MKPGKLNTVLTKIKSNPVLTIVTTVGALVIAISSFTGAIKDIKAVVADISGTETAVDISGKWLKLSDEDEMSQHIYYSFKNKENRLFGVALKNGKERKIIEGSVIGSKITFKLKNKYMTVSPRFSRATKEWSAPKFGINITHYNGKIEDDIIIFEYHDDQGNYGEDRLKRIVDLTLATKVDKNQNGQYLKLYNIASHKGGVQSLSFGIDKYRYDFTDALKLVSGGATDGKLKIWDTKTAELKIKYDSESLTDSSQKKGAVELRVDASNGDIRIVSLSENKQDLAFYYIGDGRFNHKETITGELKKITMSKNSRVISTATNTTDKKSSITVKSSEDSNKRKNTIPLKGSVNAIALNNDGSLILVSQTLASGAFNLKLMESFTGVEKWSLTLNSTIDHLNFNPSDTIFAAANKTSNQIEIRDSLTGDIKYTLPGKQGIGIATLSFNNSGKLLAAANISSGKIKLWNIEQQKLDHEIDNPETGTTLSFSYDDRLLAVGNIDSNLINIWGKAQKQTTQ